MPISSFSIVSLIACELNHYKPETVLDLGAGSGFYGAVVRQYVDMGFGNKTRIIGVEPFLQYRSPNWQHYTFIHIKTIEGYLEFAPATQFDCILFLDVIEHIDRLEGLELLLTLIKHLKPGGLLLVSTPGEYVEQKAEYGNELERHVSFYEPRDFTALGFTIIKDGRRKDEFNQRMTVAKFVQQW